MSGTCFCYACKSLQVDARIDQASYVIFLQVICRGQTLGLDLCCHISSCMPALSSQMLSKDVEGTNAWFPKTDGGTTRNR